ncbi:MAG: hypothetical protein Q4F12_04555 [Erysipelotrichaceae bacterium]|nr:hypothetical protein [Erysipelotrichaceae bacterium]
MFKGRKLKKSVKIFLIEAIIFIALTIGLYNYYELLFKDWKISTVVTLVSIGAGVTLITFSKIVKSLVLWFDKHKIVVEPVKIYTMQK